MAYVSFPVRMHFTNLKQVLFGILCVSGPRWHGVLCLMASLCHRSLWIDLESASPEVGGHRLLDGECQCQFGTGPDILAGTNSALACARGSYWYFKSFLGVSRYFSVTVTGPRNEIVVRGSPG